MSKSKPKVKLPKAGDTSNAAIGKRLEYVRREAGYPISRAKWFADATPAAWRSWESGKAAIPPRTAWIVGMNLRGPVEWLLTGHYTKHPVPDVLPVLGDDLSGFAARIKEARMRLGFTLADVAKVHFSPLFKERWLRWEAGEDEPDSDCAIKLAEALEVSVEWLYTDTEPAPKAAKPGKRYQVELYAGASRHGVLGSRLKAARQAAGLSRQDIALLMGRHTTASALAHLEDRKKEKTLRLEAGPYALALAMLFGVPLEELLYAEDEIINMRRRVERLRRRFGLPSPPGKRKADAA